jgi:dUTP pyrophosphatase
MALFVFTENVDLRIKLMNIAETRRVTDSGFDIPMIEQSVNSFVQKHTFDLNIQVGAIDTDGNPIPCLLLPRSSLSSTPFRLANSIGLIDMGYRGNVQARVDIRLTCVDSPIDISSGARLFQICKHDFMPWKEVNIVQYVTELPKAPDNRGVGRLGSTGN